MPDPPCVPVYTQLVRHITSPALHRICTASKSSREVVTLYSAVIAVGFVNEGTWLGALT